MQWDKACARKVHETTFRPSVELHTGRVHNHMRIFVKHAAMINYTMMLEGSGIAQLPNWKPSGNLIDELDAKMFQLVLNLHW
jgi:hypothetical protein